MFPWNFPTSACAAIYLKSRKRFHAELNPDECAASPESLSSHRSSLPPFPTGARLPPSPARSIPYHPNHPPAAPPRPSKTSSFLSVHRGAWIVADFLWAHSVGHSQRENSLGESLFIFAVARDTWGKIVQLYLVHSSRPSAFPPLHPLPLHLNVYRLTPASFCFAYELKCIIFLTLFAIASLSFLLVSLFREVYRASWYT